MLHLTKRRDLAYLFVLLFCVLLRICKCCRIKPWYNTAQCLASHANVRRSSSRVPAPKKVCVGGYQVPELRHVLDAGTTVKQGYLSAVSYDFFPPEYPYNSFSLMIEFISRLQAFLGELVFLSSPQTPTQLVYRPPPPFPISAEGRGGGLYMAGYICFYVHHNLIVLYTDP